MNIVILFLFIGFWPWEFCHASNFPDIQSPELLEATDYLSEHDIIQGYPDGTFQPEQSINRAEALKIIFKTTETNTVEAVQQNPFPDVDVNQWFAAYVHQAKELGIIRGYPDGNYIPWQEVNRAEFIKIAISALPYYEEPSDFQAATSQYSDLDTSQWYMPYLSFAVEKNFLSNNFEFHPSSPMKRGEAALIICKIHQDLQPQPQLSYTTVIDPLSEELYNNDPYDFDSDKLLVIQDIDHSEIQNHYHSYQIIYDENIRASGNSRNNDETLRIEFSNQCQLDIYTVKHPQLTPEEYLSVRFDHENFTEEPLSLKLIKLDEYPDLQAYKIVSDWEKIGNVEFYFVYTNDKIYEFNVHSAAKTNCAEIIHKTLISFNPY